MAPRFAFIPFAFAFFVVCMATPSLATATPDELIWRGDMATGRALMDDLAKDYAKEKKGKIVLQPFSTLSGLDAVENGSADIAGSARGKYARRAQEANIDFVPVALDAAVLITHPKNPVDNLTLKQIYDIYYGRITNWKDVGGLDHPINLYSIASPLDGVEFSLRQLVYRNGAQPVAAPRLYLNTAKLEEAVTLDPSGLGLSTLASTYANPKVKRLSVEGVAASTATVADASYPLYITLYLADRGDSPKHAEIDRFIAYLGTPTAQQILRRHQLIPYADATDVVARNEQRMAFIDAHVGRSATEGAAATLAATTPAPTPVSAPRAMLQSKLQVAPTAESTLLARENLARAEKKKQAEKEAVRKKAVAARAAKKSAPAKEVAKTAPKKASPHAKTRVAKAASQKASAAKGGPRTKAYATEKTPAAKKPAVSFGDVSGGASGG